VKEPVIYDEAPERINELETELQSLDALLFLRERAASDGGGWHSLGDRTPMPADGDLRVLRSQHANDWILYREDADVLGVPLHDGAPPFGEAVEIRCEDHLGFLAFLTDEALPRAIPNPRNGHSFHREGPMDGAVVSSSSSAPARSVLSRTICSQARGDRGGRGLGNRDGGRATSRRVRGRSGHSRQRRRTLGRLLACLRSTRAP
jgi:hypothetical protein